MSLKITTLMAILAILTSTTQAQCYFKPRQTPPNNLQQETDTTVILNLDWKMLNLNTSGFVLGAYALCDFLDAEFVLNITGSLTFMGAVKVNGKGNGGWGIPDCTSDNGCDAAGSTMISNQGKDYIGNKANFFLNFTISSSPREPPLSKLPAVLVQFINGTSPYPFGPYHGLGLGSRSHFWSF